jgi:hypothetical protein
MVESPAGKPAISPELAETFFEAVRAYIRWSFGGPEPNITVDQDAMPISTICRRVHIFTDPLPEEVFNALWFVATNEPKTRLKEKLSADRTYETAAEFLLKLIQDREAEWREEWHRTE